MPKWRYIGYGFAASGSSPVPPPAPRNFSTQRRLFFPMGPCNLGPSSMSAPANGACSCSLFPFPFAFAVCAPFFLLFKPAARGANSRFVAPARDPARIRVGVQPARSRVVLIISSTTVCPEPRRSAIFHFTSSICPCPINKMQRFNRRATATDFGPRTPPYLFRPVIRRRRRSCEQRHTIAGTDFNQRLTSGPGSVCSTKGVAGRGF